MCMDTTCACTQHSLHTHTTTNTNNKHVLISLEAKFFLLGVSIKHGIFGACQLAFRDYHYRTTLL